MSSGRGWGWLISIHTSNYSNSGGMFYFYMLAKSIWDLYPLSSFQCNYQSLLVAICWAITSASLPTMFVSSCLAIPTASRTCWIPMPTLSVRVSSRSSLRHSARSLSLSKTWVSRKTEASSAWLLILGTGILRSKMRCNPNCPRVVASEVVPRIRRWRF
jgi:hypothetical protein